MSVFAVWVGSRNHSIQTVSVRGPSRVPPCPPRPPPLFSFCSLVIMTSSDSGEQGRGMGRGAGSWPTPDGPYFEMVSIRIFKKSALWVRGFYIPPPPIKPLAGTRMGLSLRFHPPRASLQPDFTAQSRAMGAFAAGVVPRNAPRKKAASGTRAWPAAHMRS